MRPTLANSRDRERRNRRVTVNGVRAGSSSSKGTPRKIDPTILVGRVNTHHKGHVLVSSNRTLLSRNRNDPTIVEGRILGPTRA